MDNEITEMINKLVDSGTINNPESVKILTDYHVKMTEALTEREKVKLEKRKIFKDELEDILNFAIDSFDRGNAIIERYRNEQHDLSIEQKQQ